jgi:hypothetical protein
LPRFCEKRVALRRLSTFLRPFRKKGGRAAAPPPAAGDPASGGAGVGLQDLAGCSGPRVVFVPSADAPVRAGPGVRGRVYVWTGATWELSRNRVPIPEGLYIWDAGDPVPGREQGAEQP